MPTDADIGNQALSRLGTKAIIADLSESSTEARVLNAHYATVRDSILRARNWNFARMTAALSLSGTAPNRWTYSYAWPDGCLRFLRLDLGSQTSPLPALPFEIGTDGNNRFILTDIAEAYGVFTRQITDANQWDPEFTVCFVDALAAAAAFPITQKMAVAEELRKRAVQSLDAAAAESANEDQTPGWAEFEADAITARA